MMTCAPCMSINMIKEIAPTPCVSINVIKDNLYPLYARKYGRDNPHLTVVQR